jgi:hypothetical protein
MTNTWIGIIGVGLLLLAFVLNLARKLEERSPLYLVMNAAGAALAAWYAWAGDVLPFVVLELVWCGAALARLASLYKSSPR